MISKYFLIFVTASFFISCNNNDSQQEKKEMYTPKKWIKKFYSSGKIQSTGFYVKDTIPVDTLSYYSEDGNLYSTEIRDSLGVLNGVAKIYYPNGQIFQLTNYINGLTQGWGYDFYDNGKLKCRSFHLNDKHAGDIYFYNEDGSYKSYGFFDFGEIGRNKIKWDSATGNVTYDLRQVIFLDSIKQSDKDVNLWDINVLISNPPKSHTNVIIDYISTKNVLLESDTVNNNIPFYQAEKRFIDTLVDVKISSSEYDSLTKKTIYQALSTKFE
jgi:hypothetical protein